MLRSMLFAAVATALLSGPAEAACKTWLPRAGDRAPGLVECCCVSFTGTWCCAYVQFCGSYIHGCNCRL